MYREEAEKLTQEDQFELIQKEIEMLVKKRQAYAIRESQFSQPKVDIGRHLVQKYRDLINVSRLIEGKLMIAHEDSFEAVAAHIKSLVISLFEKYREASPEFFEGKKLYYLTRIKQKMADLIRIKNRKLLLSIKPAKFRTGKENEIKLVRELTDDASACLEDFDITRFDRFSKRVIDNLNIFTSEERAEILKLFEYMETEIIGYKEANNRKMLGEALLDEMNNAKPFKFNADKAIRLLQRNFLIDDNEQDLELALNQAHDPKLDIRELIIEKKHNRIYMVDKYQHILGTLTKQKTDVRVYDRMKDVEAKAFDRKRVDDLIKKIDQVSRKQLAKGLIQRKDRSLSKNLQHRNGGGSIKIPSVKKKDKYFAQYSNRLRSFQEFKNEGTKVPSGRIDRSLTREKKEDNSIEKFEDKDKLLKYSTLQENLKQREVRFSCKIGAENAKISKNNEPVNIFVDPNIEETSDDEYNQQTRRTTPNFFTRDRDIRVNKQHNTTLIDQANKNIFHDDLFEIKISKIRKNPLKRKNSVPDFAKPLEEFEEMEETHELLSDFKKCLYSLSDEQLLQIQSLMHYYKDNPVLEEIKHDYSLDPRKKLLSLLKASYNFQYFPQILDFTSQNFLQYPSEGFFFELEKRPIINVNEKSHKDCYSFFCKVAGQEDICPHGYANSKVLDRTGDIINTRTKEIIIKGDRSVKSKTREVKSKGKLVGIPDNKERSNRGLTMVLRNKDIYDFVLADKRMRSESYRKKVLKNPDIVIKSNNIKDVSPEIAENDAGRSVSLRREDAMNSQKHLNSRRQVSTRNSKRNLEDKQVTPEKPRELSINEETEKLSGKKYFYGINFDQKYVLTSQENTKDKNRINETIAVKTLNKKNDLQSDRYIIPEDINKQKATLSRKTSWKDPKKHDQHVTFVRNPMTESKNSANKNTKDINNRKDSLVMLVTEELGNVDETSDYFDMLVDDQSKNRRHSKLRETSQTGELKGKLEKNPLETELSEIKQKIESHTKNLAVSDKMIKAYSNRLIGAINVSNNNLHEEKRNFRTDRSNPDIAKRDLTPSRVQSLNHPNTKNTENVDTFDPIDRSIDTKSTSQNKILSKTPPKSIENGLHDKIAGFDLLEFGKRYINSKRLSRNNVTVESLKNTMRSKNDSNILNFKPIGILSGPVAQNNVNNDRILNTMDIAKMLPGLHRDRNPKSTQELHKKIESNYFDLDSGSNPSSSSKKDPNNLNKHIEPNFSHLESQSLKNFIRQKTSQTIDNNFEFNTDKKIPRITTISTPFSGLIEQQHESDYMSDKKSKEHKHSDISDYFNNL